MDIDNKNLNSEVVNDSATGDSCSSKLLNILTDDKIKAIAKGALLIIGVLAIASIEGTISISASDIGLAFPIIGIPVGAVVSGVLIFSILNNTYSELQSIDQRRTIAQTKEDISTHFSNQEEGIEGDTKTKEILNFLDKKCPKAPFIALMSIISFESFGEEHKKSYNIYQEFQRLKETDNTSSNTLIKIAMDLPFDMIDQNGLPILTPLKTIFSYASKHNCEETFFQCFLNREKSRNPDVNYADFITLSKAVFDDDLTDESMLAIQKVGLDLIDGCDVKNLDLIKNAFEAVPTLESEFDSIVSNADLNQIDKLTIIYALMPEEKSKSIKDFLTLFSGEDFFKTGISFSLFTFALYDAVAKIPLHHQHKKKIGITLLKQICSDNISSGKTLCTRYANKATRLFHIISSEAETTEEFFKDLASASKSKIEYINLIDMICNGTVGSNDYLIAQKIGLQYVSDFKISDLAVIKNLTHIVPKEHFTAIMSLANNRGLTVDERLCMIFTIAAGHGSGFLTKPHLGLEKFLRLKYGTKFFQNEGSFSQLLWNLESGTVKLPNSNVLKKVFVNTLIFSFKNYIKTNDDGMSDIIPGAQDRRDNMLRILSEMQ